MGRLFDRFFTEEAARNSSDLGLSISRALVEQMGGTISAKIENHVFSVTIVFKQHGAQRLRTIGGKCVRV